MNPDFPNRLAAQLRDNPSLLEELDDILLGELIGHYYEGELNANDAAEVASMLQINPKAKAIYQRIEAANRFATSQAGKTWLQGLQNRVLPPTTAPSQPASAPAFFDRLSEWMPNFFGPSLQSAYADASLEGLVHRFASRPGDPYRSRLVRDAAGQWRLLVSTSDAVAAKLKVCLEIEAEAPVISFVEGESGRFIAEVLLTDEMVHALQSGHRPVFRPVG
jgi:anti-sigma factor RsiW